MYNEIYYIQHATQHHCNTSSRKKIKTGIRLRRGEDNDDDDNEKEEDDDNIETTTTAKKKIKTV